MKLLKYWKPILISLFILYGSVISGENINKLHFINIPYFDKITHFVFYFLLSITFYASLYRSTALQKNDQIIITLFIVISYGIIMEMLQFYLTSTRYAEIFDALANTFGCISGVISFPVFKKINFIRYL